MRKNIYARDVVAVRASGPVTGVRGVVVELGTVTGLAAVQGRTAVVHLSHDDLARIIGAIPAGSIPDEAWPAFVKILKWLDPGIVAKKLSPLLK